MSKTDLTGNPEALRAHKQASQRHTRVELELALSRLRNGNPKRVKRGLAISPTSVATEAGVERSTLYRYHEPVLVEIRKHNNSTSKKQLDVKRTEFASIEAKAREYRKMLEAQRDDMQALARQNYALSHRNEELEQLLKLRDETIVDLQVRLRETGNITPFQRVSIKTMKSP